MHLLSTSSISPLVVFLEARICLCIEVTIVRSCDGRYQVVNLLWESNNRDDHQLKNKVEKSQGVRSQEYGIKF